MIIAVDFDGTLCENAWPYIGAPKWDVIRYVQAAKGRGDQLILWTNRSGEQLEEAVAWCKNRAITFDAVNENLPEVIERFGGDTRKVFANIYLDDRAVSPYFLHEYQPEQPKRPKKIRFPKLFCKHKWEAKNHVSFRDQEGSYYGEQWVFVCRKCGKMRMKKCGYDNGRWFQ